MLEKQKLCFSSEVTLDGRTLFSGQAGPLALPPAAPAIQAAVVSDPFPHLSPSTCSSFPSSSSFYLCLCPFLTFTHSLPMRSLNHFNKVSAHWWRSQTPQSQFRCTNRSIPFTWHPQCHPPSPVSSSTIPSVVHCPQCV